ncbi:patatin-like phospholipase family protein [Granulosicoccaceae sp. 1_MG-2023]|nr:patatin-like phospholipase family protein [Granulosicoccaceae sp. 1_MG-2023]
MEKPRIAVALGSGGARGWAHIGVLDVLLENGIRPDIVCGSSIGALVGGAYCCDKLDVFREWTLSLTWKDIVALMDISLSSGGLIEGKRLVNRILEHLQANHIEDLPTDYAAVATELHTGQEVWLRSGPLIDAMRASFALPGLFSPVLRGNRWLTDGGLVNPVPVSPCRALGADFIIAVNLNSRIAGSRRERARESARSRKHALENLASEWVPDPLRAPARKWLKKTFRPPGEVAPSYTDVMIGSINIMQDRITKSRMAGDPPDIVLSPRLGHLGVMDYDCAAESIAEGRTTAEYMLPTIRELLADVGRD